MEQYNKIYIDPDESLNALLEKIQSAEEDKLIIIIHKNSSVFSGQVNIELIKTYATRADKELIFITNFKQIRKLLVKVGFEVYNSLEEFESGVNNIEQEEVQEELTVQHYSNLNSNPKKGILKKLIIFLASFLLLGLIWMYFYFPAITIEVNPVIKDKILVSQIKAVNGLEEVDLSKSSLPLIQHKVNLTQKIKVDATGRRTIGTKRATGVLTLINTNRKQVSIPQGTIVATGNGIKFRILDKVVIPAAQVDKFMDMVVGMTAGKTEVSIEAINKGIQGNVSRSRITKFANKSYPIKIINPEPTTGGKNDIVNVVTQQDIERGIKLGKEKLVTVAKQKLSDKFDPNATFFKNNIMFGEQSIKCKNQPGEITTALTVVGKLKVTGFGVEKEGLKDLIFKLYQKSLKNKFKLKTQKITISDLKVKEINSEQVNLVVKSKGQVIGQLNKEELIDKIVGKKVTTAKEALDKMSQIANYKIKPNNQVNLPEFKLGVNLVIKDPIRK